MPQTSSALLQNGKPRLSHFVQHPEQRGSVWLDSALSSHRHSRRSLCASNPIAEMSWRAGNVGPEEIADSLRHFLNDVERRVNAEALTAIGYITYEATLPFVGLIGKPLPAWMPGAHFFLYDHIDESACSIDAVHEGNDPNRPTAELVLPNRKAYTEPIEKIKNHIFEGDIYQANFTTPLQVASKTPPFEIYQRLRVINPAPFGAYLSLGDWAILSSSPELMFRREGNRITTSPIKGTASRPNDPGKLQHAVDTLLASEKDLAELMMIVDLERNDLGKIAEIGSVTVDHLVRAELYSSLIHLVSDISAEIRPDLAFGDICEALLPGGSVTGAPKKRAVEILLDMETEPRGVYCGYIGFVTPQAAEFNLAIRTMTWHDGRYEIHAGGGIVADSEPEAEYEEMLLKARNLQRAVGIDA